MISNTIQSARIELTARKGEWPTICRATGLTYWWVTKFAQGKIVEPGVTRIEKLLTYFSDHPREMKAA